MSLAHLLDHTVTIWRATEGFASGGLRTVDKTWSSTGRTGLKAAIQVQGESRGDTGGGERTLGTHLGFMDAGANVQEGDIVQVTAGPGTWQNMLVEGVSPPRGHHVELELSVTAEAVS